MLYGYVVSWLKGGTFILYPSTIPRYILSSLAHIWHTDISHQAKISPYILPGAVANLGALGYGATHSQMSCLPKNPAYSVICFL